MSYDKKLKDDLLRILEQKSIIRGDITLASGRKSAYYIDVKMTSLDRDGVVLCAQLFSEELEGIDAVGGPTIGADPFIGAILYECRKNNKPISGFLVRKQSKSHGTQKLIEGPLKKGDKVAVLEDVITTGGSVLLAIQTIEEFGAKVVKVLCVVDREEGGEGFLKERGYPLFSIFKKSELNL